VAYQPAVQDYIERIITVWNRLEPITVGISPGAIDFLLRWRCRWIWSFFNLTLRSILESQHSGVAEFFWPSTEQYLERGMGDPATVAELLIAFSPEIDDSRSRRAELLTHNGLVMYGEEAQKRFQEGHVWLTQYAAPRVIPSSSAFGSDVDFAAIESLQRQQEQQRNEHRSLWQQQTAQALQSHRAATGISTSPTTCITEPTEASEVRTQMRARSRLVRSSQRIRRQRNGFVRLPPISGGYKLLSSGYQEAALASREADGLDARDLVYSSTTSR